MYGKSEQVIGDITAKMEIKDDFFYATKVWTNGLQEGIRQMTASMKKMKRKQMDLMQIHNLSDWKTYLPLLQQWKAAGEIRYTGITHYTDASHDQLEQIITSQKVDFVQFNYSISSRHAEKRLLSACADRGVATIINRPFGEGGGLFDKVKGKPLPPWAADLGIESWSAYFLKYIIAHPAVTCVIPATANAAHEADNVKAGVGLMPDEATREKMVDYLISI